MQYGERGRDWSDVLASQAMPRIAGHHQKLRIVKEGFYLDLRGSMVLQKP
jgi:hypothetical protein